MYNTSYMGHLYALQLTNGIVSNVMMKKDGTANEWTTDLLKTWDSTAPGSWQNTTAVPADPATAANPLGTFGNTANDNSAGSIGLSTNANTTGWAGGVRFQLGVPANPNATKPCQNDWKTISNGKTHQSHTAAHRWHRT